MTIVSDCSFRVSFVISKKGEGLPKIPTLFTLNVDKVGIFGYPSPSPLLLITKD